jgi:hypothetical protein
LVSDTHFPRRSLHKSCSCVRDVTTSFSMISFVCSTTSTLLLWKRLPNCLKLQQRPKHYKTWFAKHLSLDDKQHLMLLCQVQPQTSLMHLVQLRTASMKRMRASWFSYRPTAPPLAWRFLLDCSRVVISDETKLVAWLLHNKVPVEEVSIQLWVHVW